MLLLKYFSAWKTHCEATDMVRKNNALIEATNLATSMSEREKTFSHLYAPLSTQKKLLQFQNIKLSVDPIQMDNDIV